MDIAVDDADFTRASALHVVDFAFGPRYCLVYPVDSDDFTDLLHLVVVQVPVRADTRLQDNAFGLLYKLLPQHVYLDVCFFLIKRLLIQRQHYLFMECVVEVRVVLQHLVIFVVKDIRAIHNILAL